MNNPSNKEQSMVQIIEDWLSQLINKKNNQFHKILNQQWERLRLHHSTDHANIRLRDFIQSLSHLIAVHFMELPIEELITKDKEKIISSSYMHPWVKEIFECCNKAELAPLLSKITPIKETLIKDPSNLAADYYFEHYLSSADKAFQRQYGVFYTPYPVVRFIVHSISLLLKEYFFKQDFLCSELRLLDFAAGSGAFIKEVFSYFLRQLNEQAEPIQNNPLVNDHLFKHFIGIEPFLTPFLLMQNNLMKLLYEANIHSVDPLSLTLKLKSMLEYQGFLDEYCIQDKTLIVLGNPPYNVRSKNTNHWISKLLEDYKPKNEKKLNLDDDYIKFIRLAGYLLENAKQGIIGIITNNSFLDGITHRKMRSQIWDTFDLIYVINLHGDARRSGIPGFNRDNSKDENVFEIRQGVCIVILIKNAHLDKSIPKLQYYDLIGTRAEKFDFLNSQTLHTIKWQPIQVDHYNDELNQTKWGKTLERLSLFTPFKNKNQLNSYSNFWGLPSIFNVYSSGVKTERDKIVIKLSQEELQAVLYDFQSLSEAKLKEKYNTQDSRDWKIASAKEDVIKNKDNNPIIRIHYRPFDFRYTFYTGKSRGFVGTPQKNIAQTFLNKDNLGLAFSRTINSSFHHCFVTKTIIESGFLNTFSYIAPLYIFPLEPLNHTPQSNISSRFLNTIEEQLKINPDPQEIMGYIYSLLNAPHYAEQFNPFLKLDFPRIPLFADKDLFYQLSALGLKLMDYHCLYAHPDENFSSMDDFFNPMDELKVEYIRYEEDKHRLIVNRHQYIKGIEPELYQYTVGKNQVIKQWLRNRKGRVIKAQELLYLLRIIQNIRDAQQILKQLDPLVKGWI